MSFDPEMFGQAIGETIKEAVERLENRIDGMQAKLDKCMAFSGNFQNALDYAPGALVRRGGQMFVATRHIKSGGKLVARDGSGWERII